MRMRSTLVTVFVAAALFGAGCASTEAGDTTTETGASETTANSAAAITSSETTSSEGVPLRIGLLQFLPTFNIFVAEQEGFFDDEGLDVELVYIQDFNLIGQAVESGDVEIGARNYDGILSAIAQDFEWRVVYPHVLYSSDAPDAQLMVRSDLFGSPEEAAQALEGETFAVNVGTQSWMASQVYLENEWGVDPSTLEYVEIPYADILAAFDQGTAAGAHVVEPFAAQMEEAGVGKPLGPHLDSVALLPPHGNGTERFLIQASFARSDWIAENADTMERFVSAMNAATESILENPDQYNDLAVEFTGMEESVVLGELYPDRYIVDSSVTADEALAEIRFNAATGLIDKELTLDEVLAEQFPLAP
ncbi:MAG: hypothetical protein GEU79_03315 [Acidimicrobiia bacterium]|nr:hypothetical protein [Acidimicrobiia bacterium]